MRFNLMILRWLLVATLLLWVGAAFAGTPPSSLDDAAERERAGDQLADEGDPAGAVAAYVESFTIRDQLGHDAPERREWVAEQASVLEKIESLMSLHRPALADPRAALAISQLLAATRPHS